MLVRELIYLLKKCDQSAMVVVDYGEEGICNEVDEVENVSLFLGDYGDHEILSKPRDGTVKGVHLSC